MDMDFISVAPPVTYRLIVLCLEVKKESLQVLEIFPYIPDIFRHSRKIR